MPWIKRFEEEIQRQLMGEFSANGARTDYYGSNVFAHLEVKGLLRGDMKSRMEFYKGLFFMGSITPNEIRALEDMNPISAPGMDSTYVQGATVPIALAGMMQAAGVKPEPEEPEDVESKVINLNVNVDASQKQAKRFLINRDSKGNITMAREEESSGSHHLPRF
jgi:hypothetical protein